jgi:hypothetical protein
MPQLTKAELAKLMSEMQGASKEDILAEAARREGFSDLERQVAGMDPSDKRSTAKKAWDYARTPLTDAPSRAAKVAGDAIDQRSLGESKLGAQLKGFAAGALQGAGDLVSSFTSPLDLALTLTGYGAAKAGAKGLMGISKAARAAEAGLQVPLVAEGAYNVAEGVAEGNYGKAAMGAVQGAMGGVGIKAARTHSFPPAKVRDAYMKSKGREVVPSPRVEKLDPEFSKATADAYQAMEHNPNDPRVAAAYQAMADETSDQFAFLRDQAGVKMEPWTTEGQPYANSAEMMEDVVKNNRLFYFPSEAGYGQGAVQAADNFPLLKPGKSGAPVNDEFRAAHDYFGHAVEGNQFGPLGEERAYQAHRTMFPEEAVPALTTETRGQNSWVNFGEHLRRSDGSIPKKGEPGFVAPQDRPFAEQKTGLLPEQFLRADVGQSSPTAAAASPQARAASSAISPNAASPGTGTGAPSTSPTAYTLDEAASNVATLTSQHGGSTFNLQKGSLSGTPHYAVSIYPERGVVVDGPASPEAIAQFVQKNADLLQDPQNSIGTWFNKEDGKTYLDVSVTSDNLDDALRLGQEKNQLAIFDLGNFEEIKVPQQGLTGAAPVVSQMAGDVPPEFHAVEAQTAPVATGLKASERQIELTGNAKGNKAVALEKERLDKFRNEAAEKRMAAEQTPALAAAAPPVVVPPTPAAAFQLALDPTAINGKTFYHGTGTRNLTAEALDPVMTKAEGLFGQGVYLTDNADIARGYAKARGKRTGTPTVYEAGVNVNKVLNLEGAAPPEIGNIFRHQAEQLADTFGDDIVVQNIDEVLKNPNHTPEDVIRAFSEGVEDLSHAGEIPSGELQEYFTDIAARLKEAGYDALTHTGGKRTGKDPHQVLIMLDPNDTLGKTGRVGQVKSLKALQEEASSVQPRTSPLGATVLGSGSLAASAGIPDDPDSKWDDYGRLGLNLAGLVGAGAVGAAALKAPRTGQKLHASQAAGMMLAGVPKAQWAQRLRQAGATDIPKVLQGASLMVAKQVEKLGKQMTSAKKLTAMFEAGKGEMKWYDDTHKELQELFGKDAEMMAGFLTATSINSTVKSNTSLALKAYRQWKTGEDFNGFLPAVIMELNRVKSGQPLAGRKLDNFRKAIIGDPDAVVVDRWMMRAFGIPKDAATPAQYDMIEQAVKELAMKQGVTPRQMQAAIWFGAKTAAEKGKARPESPSFGTAIKSKIDKDHGEALKENAKITKARQNPNLF